MKSGPFPGIIVVAALCAGVLAGYGVDWLTGRSYELDCEFKSWSLVERSRGSRKVPYGTCAVPGRGLIEAPLVHDGVIPGAGVKAKIRVRETLFWNTYLVVVSEQ